MADRYATTPTIVPDSPAEEIALFMRLCNVGRLAFFGSLDIAMLRFATMCSSRLAICRDVLVETLILL
jgi:hypothetical protein